MHSRKARGISLPEQHGVKGGLDMNVSEHEIIVLGRAMLAAVLSFSIGWEHESFGIEL